MSTLTSRKIVRDGIAKYFGGTYQPDFRCWQHGPLVANGLGTVRKAFPKRLDDADYTAGMLPGRSGGAFMVVEIPGDREGRRPGGIGGPPVTDSQGNITSGGIKSDMYQVVLNVFHLSWQEFAEDAQDDVDQLIEAIKQRLRVDRTLGGICTDAGGTRYGIQTSVGRPGVDGERTYVAFQIRFEVLTQFTA